MKEYIESVIIPRLRGDGGWLDVVSIEGSLIKVRLQGECSKCNIAPRCMDWICQQIKRDLGQEVRIEFIRKKPFFWDNE